MELDYLILAAHPDDAELHCGGLIVKMRRRNRTVGVFDLTRGEAATRGTVADRERETAAANRILDLSWRGNAGLPDGGVRDDDTARQAIVEIIRRFRVKILIAPLGPCRHPDHEATWQLGRSCMFFAGNGGFPCEHEPWRPLALVHHPEDVEVEPSFVVDISEEFDAKMRALQCYETQFWSPQRGETGTYIGSERFHHRWLARHRIYGARINAEYGEAYIAASPPRLDDPLTAFTNHRQ